MGFTTKEQRDFFSDKARKLEVDAEVHYLDAPLDTRVKRVEKRNTDKDPSVYSFDVTDEMFDFMEPMFEIPDQEELKNGCKVQP